LSARQKAFAIVVAIVLILSIFELIRRRKLREEYALVWLLVGFGIVALVWAYGLLEWLTREIGAVAPTTTLFLFAFLFLIVMAMQFSIKLSKLVGQIKDLTQEIGILRAELEELGRGKEPVRRESPMKPEGASPEPTTKRQGWCEGAD
jgi:Mg2+/citrate symporter